MLRFLADEDLKRAIVRGLADRCPELDVVRVQEVGLRGVPDPEILQWAAERGRIVVTHDVTTMTRHAYDRVRSGRIMPGVFHVPQAMAVGHAVEDLLLMAEYTDAAEWTGRVVHLPLR